MRLSRIPLCLLFFFALNSFALKTALGQVLLKADGSGDYPNIQAAIEAASDGWEIVLSPGIYRGPGNRNLDPLGKAITIRSVDPEDPEVVSATVIDCENQGIGFHIHSGETHQTIIAGITIINGTGSPAAGIYCENGSPTIRNCVISSCDRIGVRLSGGTLENCRVESCTGTGIVARNGSTVTGCTVSDNTFRGIYCHNSRIERCIVTRNGSAGTDGGGIYAEGNSQVIACDIEGNVGKSGGGIYGYGALVKVSRCLLMFNGAMEGGAAFGSYFTLEDCIIAENSASTAAAIYSQGSVKCKRCTVINNQAGENSGAIKGNISVSHCIVWHNAPAQFSEHSGSVVYSAIEGGYTGTGNIADDPLLTADGHLRSGSPCMDAGNPNYNLPAEAVDIDNDPRIHGSRIDIGADEFVDTDADGLPDWWEQKYFGSSTAAQPGDDPDGDGQSNLQEYVSSTHPLSAPGQPVTLYVDPVSGNDAWDGLAPAWDGTHGPKATIQGAINAAPPPGATIVLAAASYTGPGNCDLHLRGGPITLRSQDPDDPSVVADTVIDCQGSSDNPRRALTAGGGEQVTLEGITITGGYADKGGAILCNGGTVTLRKCRLTGNHAESAGGAIWCENGGSVSLESCTLTGNSATDGGALYCGPLGSLSVTGSTIADNRATEDGGGIFCTKGGVTVRRCYIARNEAQQSGGGLCFVAQCTGLIKHTIIAANRATYGGGLHENDAREVTLTNCTIAFNTGSGVSRAGGEIRTHLLNCIAWNNWPTDISRVKEDYCCFRTEYYATSAVTKAPKLRPDGRLTAESPCIDAGDPQTPLEPDETDIDGEPRLSGQAVDIGADEFVDTDGDGLADWWEAKYFGSDTAADPHADPDADGLDNLEEFVFATDPLTPVKTYYVDPVSGNDAWDGLAPVWDGTHGPKATIAAAVQAAPGNGERIVLAPGEYRGQGNRDVEIAGKTLLITSSNPDDPAVVEATVIDCTGTEQDPHRAFAISLAPLVVIRGITITNGYAEKGGALACENSQVLLSKCVLRNNRAKAGGALKTASADVTLRNCRLEQNVADSYEGGGAIYAEAKSNLELSGCSLSENSAWRGGAIYTAEGFHITITACEFTGNTAKSDGGALYLVCMGGDVADCVMQSNHSGGSGGAVYLTEEFVTHYTVERCTFTDNIAADSGGALAAFDGVYATVAECTFRSNEAHAGGAMAGDGKYTEVHLSHCTVTENEATFGGGIYAYCGVADLTNCTISGNTAQKGGGIYCVGETTLRNCLIAGNTAQDGGGIAANTGPVTITGSTIYSNKATRGSGILLNIVIHPMKIRNSIVWNNTIARADWSSVWQITYSDVQGRARGEGNISVDPLLTPDGHLTADSPCIDAANIAYAAYPVGQTDIDGEPRLAGVGADMGADEFIDSDGDGLPDWWETKFFGGPTAAAPDGDPDSDGSTNLEEYKAGTNPLKAPGRYYVDPINGNDEWDGLSPVFDGSSGPKATIQAAIDAAPDSQASEIILAPGIYSGPGNRDVDFRGKPVTVRSTDPDDPQVVAATIIDAEGSADEPHRGFVFHSGEENLSVLEGVTVRNGYAEEGGGVYCNGSSPTIKNCVITGCRATRGGGFYIELSQAIIADCQATGNHAQDGGGGYLCGAAVAITRCTFTENLAANAGGGLYLTASPAFISDSAVTANQATRWGGGIYMLHNREQITIKSTLISGNVSDEAGGGMHMADSKVALQGCWLTENTSLDGGAIAADFSPVTIENCVLTANTGARRGAGLYVFDFAGVTVTNSVFTDNDGYALFNYCANYMTAKYCYWGTCNHDEIAAMIYDHADDPHRGQVYWWPYMPDFDGNGCVDLLDILQIANRFGAVGMNMCEDINRDNRVDLEDLWHAIQCFGWAMPAMP